MKSKKYFLFKYALILICAVIFGEDLCLSQSNRLVGTIGWGKSVQGIQLSVAMTNDIFQVGYSTFVTAVTRNSSTNAITMDISVPMLNFDVSLTSDNGKTYHVTVRTIILHPRKFVTIQPGGENVVSIPVTFRDEIEPGDYTLKAVRHFKLNEKEFILESNSIKVQIIK